MAPAHEDDIQFSLVWSSLLTLIWEDYQLNDQTRWVCMVICVSWGLGALQIENNVPTLLLWCLYLLVTTVHMEKKLQVILMLK